MSNILENLSAIQFARQGDLVVQNPPKPYRGLLPPGGVNKNPDLAFGNVPQLADVISVTTDDAQVALARALNKVVKGQAQRIVINLDRSPVTTDELLSALQEFDRVGGVVDGNIGNPLPTGRTWSDLLDSGASGITQFDAATLVNRVDVIEGGKITSLYQR